MEAGGEQDEEEAEEEEEEEKLTMGWQCEAFSSRDGEGERSGRSESITRDRRDFLLPIHITIIP